MEKRNHILETEYIPIGLSQRGFLRKELKRIVNKFGNIAQVWSAFEIQTLKLQINIKRTK
jgi:hypothetical protein